MQDIEARAETQEPDGAGELVSAQLFVEDPVSQQDSNHSQLRAVIEAVVYIADEPLTLAQIAAALQQPLDLVQKTLAELAEEYSKPEHGLTIREVAGGYKMGTKPEYHESIRAFVKSLKPPLKLSLAALETLAVIAYKQPITAPEIMDIRGVQGASVLKTLIDRKLIAPAGRKNVVGKPILYKTTKEFLLQFGLKDLAELPTLKEFEELSKLAFAEPEMEAVEQQRPPIKEPEPDPEPIHDPDPSQDPDPTEGPDKAPVKD